MPALPTIGVIGTGAMGLGVVLSLVRNGFDVVARDINPQAEAAAVAAGASARSTAAGVAQDAAIVILLVVDAAQIETVLFGADSAAGALAPGAIVILSSTVAPAFVTSLAERLAQARVRLLDAPVSGGPQRAANGSMTIMVSGEPAMITECQPLLKAISGKCFVVGTRPGAAATFKVLNNQLAAVNLAAGAEAMALAIRDGVDPRRFLDVVNASSGASWIFNDRMARALDGDKTPRAATTLLNKDVGIAVETAETLAFDAPLARAARDAFAAAVAAGHGAEDDAALLQYYQDRAPAATTPDK
jgi:L-threonate 2-dehydrogenase